MTAKLFVLAAGGTGGHMVPAHALAKELRGRGHAVALITDARGAKIPGLFDDVQTHVMEAGRFTGNPLTWLPGSASVRRGVAAAGKLYKDRRPAAVVGFGGYPALPALLAAVGAGVPTAVHEQNAVLGRVNRLLARWVDAIATSYPATARLKPRHQAKARLTGNPVREEVIAVGQRDYVAPGEGETIHLLVTGGSQGATVTSRVVPDALGLLPEELRARLSVVQQARLEDVERVRARYAELGIVAEITTYFTDLPDRLAAAHLVIGRAGASTIAELTVAGRPAILVPLPIATDDHQTANAREMADARAAIVIAEPLLSPIRLAEAMRAILPRLAEAATGARACGRPEAAAALADLVEGLDRAPQMIGKVETKRVTGLAAPAPSMGRSQ